jgi:F0F1-type ATP synthase delta subunit
MKKTDVQHLADRLISEIYTVTDLKNASLALEAIALDRHFKKHATNIYNDPDLTESQKKRQLIYLLSVIENSQVHNFLSDEIEGNNTWLFDTEKIDYLDEFVKIFQQSTETVKIMHLTTAKQLSPTQLKTISKDMSKSFGVKTVLEHATNPNLISGIQVKLDNYVYDYSLRSKFQQFQREWLASLDKTTKLVGRYDPV